VSDDAQRFDVGDLSGVGEGEMTSCTVDGTDVLICRVKGELYALEDLCSHADTILSDGFLHGYTITCSLHGAQFDVRDGHHMGPPAYTGVKTFELEQAPGGGVCVVVRKAEKKDDGRPETGYFMTR
jgi:nitrite reductase/ring-hydroxylating ferredoxin subunit